MSITIFLCIAIAVISFAAFSKPSLTDQLCFYPYAMWRDNEWYRIISHSFIHADPAHLIFNMVALYSFGSALEMYFNIEFTGYGMTLYIVLYFLAVVVSSIYELFIRKNDKYYFAVGASGGVSAVIFASILISPLSEIYLFFIPVGIPGFVLGPLYLLYSAVMAKRGKDNVGHNAHFYGSVFGFIFPLLFKPDLIISFFSQVLSYRIG